MDDRLKYILGIIVVVSLTTCCVFNIIEIWTESEVLSKLKYTSVTLFFYSAIMGFLIQVSEQNQKK